MAKKKNIEKAPREMTHRQLSHHKKQLRRQRIIFIGGISVIVAIVLIIMAGWFFGEYYPLQKTIAKVYDTKISESMFIDAMEIAARTQTDIDLYQQSSSILSQLVRSELIRREAENLGITVNDEDVEAPLEGAEFLRNDAGRLTVRSSLLVDKLLTGYFDEQVPDSDTQVLMNAMLIENEELAPEVQARINNGDNFTVLAEEYALNTISRDSKGIFDWHPAAVLENKLGSSIPVDWAFSAEAKKGDISPALNDTESNKKVGYWLIKVTENPGEGEALVQALLLADRYQAEDIKSQLESGGDLAALADQFSQYSPSQTGHGDLGAVTDTQNISAAFNAYVFSPDSEIGKWSSPIKDDTYWTKGGAWIVQVVDKEENRAVSEDDRNALIYKAYNDWISNLFTNAGEEISYAISDEQIQWAVDKVQKRLSETTSS